MNTETATKDEIVEAAAELFNKKGYAAVDLGEIADRIETDRETIERHFITKAHLGAAWLDRVHSGSVRRHSQMLEDDRLPERKIRDYFGELKPWLSRNKFLGCPFTAVGSRESLVCPQVAEVVEQHKEYVRLFLTQIAAQFLGDDAAGERLGAALYLLYSGATTEAATLRSTEPVDSALRVLDALLPHWKSTTGNLSTHSLP